MSSIVSRHGLFVMHNNILNIENTITHCLSPVNDDEKINSLFASEAIREVCTPPTPLPEADFCTSSISRRKATVFR